MSQLLTSDDLPVAVDPARFRAVDCYLCGSASRRVRFTEGAIDLVECSDCGLVYVTPQLEADGLTELYQESYWQSDCAKDYGYTDYLQDGELYLRTYRKRIRHITERVSGGKLLDVGCAAGYFLAVARDAGFEIHGNDVAAPMVRHAREELGLENIELGTLESVGYPDAAFDVVTLWDVIEHLADPLSVLVECRRVLKPGGILVLETQNVASRFARVMGRRWHHYKMIEHLYHFDPKTCTALLEKAGLAAIHWTARCAGKYVSTEFMVERSARVAGFLPGLLRPFRRLGPSAVYVNPHDEMIFIARPTEPSKG